MTFQLGLDKDRNPLVSAGVTRLLPLPVPNAALAASSKVAAGRSSRGWLVLWMSGTLLSFVAGALSVRALASTLNVFEMMTVRCAGSVAILLTLVVLRPVLRMDLIPRRMGLHGLRSAVHFVSQICWALAITLLPFATVFAIEFTMPAWVALLAVLFLGERMTASRLATLVLCSVGVLVILRPGFEAFRPAALYALGAALTFAITAIFTKKLIATESTFAILFWMNLTQLPMNLAGSDPAFVLHLHAATILPLLGVTVAGLAVHYCLTNAFRCGDATVVIPLDFLRVPAIALIGWAFYGEALDAFVFIGAAFIIVGVLWNVQAEARRAQPPVRAI